MGREGEISISMESELFDCVWSLDQCIGSMAMERGAAKGWVSVGIRVGGENPYKVILCPKLVGVMWERFMSCTYKAEGCQL